MGSEYQQLVYADEADKAIRQISSNWRELVRLANLAKKASGDKERTMAVLAAGCGVILEAAAFLSQGDDCDRQELAARLAARMMGERN